MIRATVQVNCALCGREFKHILKFTRYLASDMREALERKGWRLTSKAAHCRECLGKEGKA